MTQLCRMGYTFHMFVDLPPLQFASFSKLIPASNPMNIREKKSNGLSIYLPNSLTKSALVN